MKEKVTSGEGGQSQTLARSQVPGVCSNAPGADLAKREAGVAWWRREAWLMVSNL